MQLVVQIQNTNMYFRIQSPGHTNFEPGMFCYKFCDSRALSVGGIQDALTIHEEYWFFTFYNMSEKMGLNVYTLKSRFIVPRLSGERG